MDRPVTSSNIAGIGYAGQAATFTTSNQPIESASQIRDAIGEVERLASCLHETMSHLESRLDTILTPVPPTPATLNKQASEFSPACSSVLGRIYIANRMLLGDAVQRIADLRQRVEI